MIKASLLLTLMFVCAPLLKRRSSVERHLLWATTLLLAAMLPMLSSLLPSWQPDFARRALAIVPQLSATEPSSGRTDNDVVVHADAIETSATIRVLRLVWLTGIGIMALVWFRAGWQLRKSRALAAPLEDPRWTVTLAEVSHALDVHRHIALLRSPHGVVPTTWGWMRPRIVVPASATEWPADRIRVVLAHEIGHVRRHDWIVHVLARTACTVYWFNPLFWMASSRLHQESEQACDALVLQLGVDGREYATHLLSIARALVPRAPFTPALGFVRRSTLERRFAALLGPAPPRTATRRAIFVAVMFAVVAALPLAAMTLPEMGVTVQLRTLGLPAIPNLVDTRSHDGAVTAIRDVRIAASQPSRDLAGPHVLEYSVPPLYSDEARARRIEGTVTLEVRIDSTGHADVLRVVEGLGFGLDENARLALRHWQFSPATRNGVAVDAVAEVDIAFSLANEAINELIANDMATRVGPGITPPRLVRRAAISYQAVAAAASGSVVLDVLLLEDGRPKVVRVVRSLGSQRDREAISAFEQWRFSPAMKDGRPVKVRLNAEVTFPSP